MAPSATIEDVPSTQMEDGHICLLINEMQKAMVNEEHPPKRIPKLIWTHMVGQPSKLYVGNLYLQEDTGHYFLDENLTSLVVLVDIDETVHVHPTTWN